MLRGTWSAPSSPFLGSISVHRGLEIPLYCCPPQLERENGTSERKPNEMVCSPISSYTSLASNSYFGNTRRFSQSCHIKCHHWFVSQLMNCVLWSARGSCMLHLQALCPCKWKSKRADSGGAVSSGTMANEITTCFSFFLYFFFCGCRKKGIK